MDLQEGMEPRQSLKPILNILYGNCFNSILPKSDVDFCLVGFCFPLLSSLVELAEGEDLPSGISALCQAARGKHFEGRGILALRRNSNVTRVVCVDVGDTTRSFYMSMKAKELSFII